MPRFKISMSFIENTRARMSAFARRKVGLVKKADELSKLCDLPIALVIAGPDGGGAPVVWESTEGVIDRYRALPPEKRQGHKHQSYAKAKLGKERATLARVRQGGPLPLKQWAQALKDKEDMSVEALLGSIDAALLATEERRKELGLPEDDNADGDQLLRIASDAFDLEDMDGLAEEIMWDDAQPLPLNTDLTQHAPGVQYINGGGSADMGGNQYLQLQMPGNNNLGQFAWDGFQPNATVQPGYGHQFTNGNYMYMDTGVSQMQQAPGNVNQQNDWVSLGMWGTEASSCHAFAAGNSVPAEHCNPCVGDNFTGTPGIGTGGNFMNANGNEHQTQCFADEFQYTGQDFGLHYLSDLEDGVQFCP